jgi:hypothetical protein
MSSINLKSQHQQAARSDHRITHRDPSISARIKHAERQVLHRIDILCSSRFKQEKVIHT